MNIFDKKNLYPHEDTPLLKHYSEFDSVFVGLLPFFKCFKVGFDTKGSKKVISLEEARKEDKIFEKIEDYSNMTIYLTNEEYPSDEEIIENGKVIFWREIIENTKIESNKGLNKALMTSIGGYKEQFQRHDLTKILDSYTHQNNIWHPTEGTFDYFTKKSIISLFKLADISNIVVIDEFFENKKEFDLKNMSENEFIEKVDFNDYYIYSNDQSILFSISWDYFFFFIAIKEDVISKREIEENFEGFWANQKDTHNWTWEEGEIERLLKLNP